MRRFPALLSLLAVACSSTPDAATPVHERPSDAQAANGEYVCWKEHLIDDQERAGGVAMRGPVDLVVADFDQDGAEDVVVAYAESEHVRIAYGTPGDPDEWFRLGLAEGPEVERLTGLRTGDWNGDGRLDLLVEGARPLYLQNPASEHRGFRWERFQGCEHCTPDPEQPDPLEGLDPGPVRPAGAARADIDEDGDTDVLFGTRDGLIAWLQNMGGTWQRRDIVRRAEGVYPAWIAQDIDGDGDTDFFGVRGGSGELDGLFWLEQQRAPSAVQRHQPARQEGDSPALPAS